LKEHHIRSGIVKLLGSEFILLLYLLLFPFPISKLQKAEFDLRLFIALAVVKIVRHPDFESKCPELQLL